MTARQVKLDNQNSGEPVTCETSLEIYKMYATNVFYRNRVPYQILNLFSDIFQC